MAQTQQIGPTLLALFVRQRLAELEISQSDFCRRSTFDQGLLSKIQNSLITSLSIESVLKLSMGLEVPPRMVFELIDRTDLHELVMQSYAHEYLDLFNEGVDDASPAWAEEAHQIIANKLNLQRSTTVKTRRKRWLSEDHQPFIVNGDNN